MIAWDWGRTLQVREREQEVAAAPPSELRCAKPPRADRHIMST